LITVWSQARSSPRSAVGAFRRRISNLLCLLTPPQGGITIEVLFRLANGREEVVRKCEIHRRDGRVLATGEQKGSACEIDVTGYRQALMLWEPRCGLTVAGHNRKRGKR
jgi:hypothetical protein